MGRESPARPAFQSDPETASNTFSGGCNGENGSYKCPFDKINGTESLSSVILSCLLSRHKPRNAV